MNNIQLNDIFRDQENQQQWLLHYLYQNNFGWNGLGGTVLCSFRNNINFIIAICDKSINFGNAVWWAESNTYIFGSTTKKPICECTKKSMRWDKKKIETKEFEAFLMDPYYFDFLGIERIRSNSDEITKSFIHMHSFQNECKCFFMLHHASCIILVDIVWCWKVERVWAPVIFGWHWILDSYWSPLRNVFFK